MLTEKLYYSDSHLFEFEAQVTRSEGNTIVLDRTAFFPGGGGQRCDEGLIDGIRVLRVYEKEGIVFHELERPCREETVNCTIDSDVRLRRMQNHSGEHVVSGIVHSTYGYENVGFHMSDVITIDFSGEISPEGIAEIESKANEAVRANLKITTGFPDNLAEIKYRSKLELTENVRIVEIEGIDRCACCAPHVNQTGEIGIIKILSSERHRGGMRITMLCGMDALEYIRMMQDNLSRIGETLSVPRENTSAAVDRLMAERDGLKLSFNEMEKKYALSLSDGGNCVFAELSEQAQRELCNTLVEKHGFAGVFSNGKYIIGSSTIDLRSRSKEINEVICGRGGGKSGMIQGSYTADEETIKEYFRNVPVNQI